MKSEEKILFTPLSPQMRLLLEDVTELIDRVFPLPDRFRANLPKDIAELSRLLTSGRGERGISYIGNPPMLSAYLRYFLPWNLYRLCRLLPNIDFKLSRHDTVTDLGCGPLTFACALWLCREDLRSIPLEFNCVDQNRSVLDAGQDFFSAIVGRSCQWQINAVRGDIKNVKTQYAELVCAVNVFNEMYGDISRSNENNLTFNAGKAARLLAGYGSDSPAFLVVEPGFPRCGEFISLMRGTFLEHGIRPLSPCPHDKACPVQGKERWCHFAFDTDDAPPALHGLSMAAGLPKERATLSYLYSAGKPQNPENHKDVSLSLRVISDAFPLPNNRCGRYCCSPLGLILLADEKNAIEKISNGSIITNVIIKRLKDTKSGAWIAELYK